MNFSHKIIPYAHLIVIKGSGVIYDEMKGRKTLQKCFKDIEIEIITAFGQVAEQWALLAHPRFMFVGFHNDFQVSFDWQKMVYGSKEQFIGHRIFILALLS